MCRWAVPRQEWWGFWERQTLPKETGVEWNWMNHLGRTTALWQGPGKEDVYNSFNVIKWKFWLCCFSSQVLSVHAQVRSVRPRPQGDAYWLPLHDPHEGEELAEEVRPQEEPQRFLHQLAQLRHLLNQRQTQPSRTGKTRTVLLSNAAESLQALNMRIISWTEFEFSIRHKRTFFIYQISCIKQLIDCRLYDISVRTFLSNLQKQMYFQRHTLPPEFHFIST